MTESRPTGLVVPRSIAIIMDGNGRWARARGMERIRGHEKGIRAVRESVTECASLGVEALTLYAFSEENWNRPKREVDRLMKLLDRFLIEERPTLDSNNVRLVHSGRKERLPKKTLGLLERTEQETAVHTGMVLCLAISYGGRAELVDATRQLVRDVSAGTLQADAIDEAAIAARLYRPELPDPDLLIRTAGEYRVSNFLLWQISYAEIYITETLWPEFRAKDLWAALTDYARRERRFGGVRP